MESVAFRVMRISWLSFFMNRFIESMRDIIIAFLLALGFKF